MKIGKSNCFHYQPLVSVIVPVWNRTQLALRAIRSVQAQGYPYQELIVVNDGSEEDDFELREIVRSVGGVYLCLPHAGVAAARNSGMRVARGDIFSFLDSDDEWEPGRTTAHVKYFQDHPDVFVLHNLESWFRNGRGVQAPNHLLPAQGEFFERALGVCCIGCSSFSMRRSVFERIGYFKECLRIAEDYDYWIRLGYLFPIGCIKERLTRRYSGGHPQLSDSEQAVDRYRVYSLLSCLVTWDSHECVDIRLQQLSSVLEDKTKILLSGASRRGLKNDEIIYQDLLSAIEQKDFDKRMRQFKFIEPELKTLLNVRSKLSNE